MPTAANPLEQTESWPVPTVAAAVFDRTMIRWTTGAIDRPFALASVSKVLSAIATMVAVEEGVVSLDDPVGLPGSTLRHLLSHAGGFGTEATDPTVAPGTRRVYSNEGFAAIGDHVAERAAMPFEEYLHAGLVDALELSSTDVSGHPGHGHRSSVADLARVVQTVVGNALLASPTVEHLTTAAFPDLDGVLPGYGEQTPNPWGLGVEVRGQKSPHWTGDANSPQTWGHFGRAGTFLWWDPALDAGAVVLTDRDFGPWAQRAWPPLNDAIVAALV